MEHIQCNRQDNEGHACKSSCTAPDSSFDDEAGLRDFTLEAGHGNFELLLVFWLSVPGVPLAGSRLAPSGSPLGPGGGRGWVGGDLPGAIPASCPLLAAPS